MITDFLQVYPVYTIIVISIIVTLLSSLATKYLTDQNHLRTLKQRQKELQAEMKKHKENPDKLMKIQSEMLQITGVMMKSSFKPMFVTLIPFLILFYWIKSVYTPVLAGWFWYYLGASLVSSIAFRKILKIA